MGDRVAVLGRNSDTYVALYFAIARTVRNGGFFGPIGFATYVVGGVLLGVAVRSIPVQRAVLTLPFPKHGPYDESLDLGSFVLDAQIPANGDFFQLPRAT